MKSPPPPPVDRIERTVNPVALAILLACLAGALLAVWLAPNAIGATLMTWMIVILAVCGAFGLLLYAVGMLQLPTRAGRLHTRTLSRALGRARGKRPASDRTSVHRLARRLGVRLSPIASSEIRRAR